MHFRLTPRSLTLDYLDLAVTLNCLRILQIWEPTTAKRMKIDLYYQRLNCIFEQCIDYVDIAGRSSARGH